MTKPYFRQVPNFDYVSRNPGEKYISEYIPVKNLFKRGKLREDIFGNLAYFEKYSIIGNERPDNIAAKFYGDSSLDWVILISNNILNVQSEWPLNQRIFNKIMLKKYGTMQAAIEYYQKRGANVSESEIVLTDELAYEILYNGIHHYETIEIKNSLGVTVLNSGIRISPTWKTNGNFIETINSQIADISAESYNYGTLRTVPTNVVTVSMVNSLLGVNVGDQITIENVSERQYNGKHVITEIITKSNNDVFAFRYELSNIPNNTKPTLSNPRREQVLFTIPEKSISDNTGKPIVFSSSSRYYEYWDAGLGSSVLVPTTNFIKEVTNYEYELGVEEEKRNIFILKPTYLNVIFNDMDDIMPYKKGSQQYVTENLKKGDNIRLYE